MSDGEGQGEKQIAADGTGDTVERKPAGTEQGTHDERRRAREESHLTKLAEEDHRPTHLVGQPLSAERKENRGNTEQNRKGTLPVVRTERRNYAEQKQGHGIIEPAVGDAGVQHEGRSGEQREQE